MTETQTQPHDPILATAPPSVLAGGRYVVGAEIAGGGMGVVYAARDTHLDRDVAVKVLRPEQAGRPGAAERFAEEARIAARLQHPGVAPVHDLGTLADGRPFLAMKLIRGRTLADLLHERPTPAADLPRLFTIFEAICQAVGYAHSKGVIHRDLKPGNVMVGAFGEVQVMDWGLAKVLGERLGLPPPEDDPNATAAHAPASEMAATPADRTQAGSLLGTPAYMPPEQAAGQLDRIDRRADVFALGALLCELITGKPPYVGNREAVKAMAVIGHLQPALDRLAGCGADLELVALCRGCLAVEPADRPADGTAVAAAVAAHAAGVADRLRAAEVGRAAAVAREAEQRKRRRVQLAWLASVAVAVGLLGVGLWERSRLLADRRQEVATQAAADQSALRAVLDTAEVALRADRLAEATTALTAASDRLAGAGAGELSDRLAVLTRDRDMVCELDDITESRWTKLGPQALFDHTEAVGRYPGVFRGYGVEAAGDPEAAASRVRAAVVSERLLAGLGEWFFMAPTTPGLGAVLDLLDADPQRVEVRAAVAAGDKDRLYKLLQAADGRRLPTWFVTGLAQTSVGRSSGIMADALSGILDSSWHANPSAYSVAVVLAAQPSAFIESATDGNPLTTMIQWRDSKVGRGRVAVALKPESPAGHFFYGCALMEHGRWGEAELVLTRCQQLTSNRQAVLSRLGVTQLWTGKAPEALVTLRRAVELDPTDPLAHSGLIGACALAGDEAGSVAAAKRLAEILPQSGSFRLITTGGRVERALDYSALVEYYAKAGRLHDAYLLGVAQLRNDPVADRDASPAEYSLQYNTACVALLWTNAPDGKAAPAVDRPALRQRAYELLMIALTLDTEFASKTDKSDLRAMTAERLTHWLTDPDLATVRHPICTGLLPADERDRWRAFWAKVRQLRDETATKP